MASFKPTNGISVLNPGMATLQQRLEEVMKAKNWEHADLMRVSGQSSSVVSQWLGKGSKDIKEIGKLEAAIYLERASGYSALWIAKGLGPKHAHTTPTVAREPGARYDTPAQTLAQLGRLLAAVPPSHREAVAANMAGWARDGGADHWQVALAGLLSGVDSKRVAQA